MGILARPSSDFQVTRSVSEGRFQPGISDTLADGAGYFSGGSAKKVGLTLAAMALIAMLGVIIVKIKTKDGKETEVAINVPGEVSSVSTTVREGDVAKAVSKNVADANGAKFITLAKLDPAKIPESERFDWQPDELVAVIGEHRLRDWGTITRVEFHPSGDFFVSSTDPYLANSQVWSTKTLERLTGSNDPGFPGGVANYGLCFSPDGKSFWTGRGKYGVDLSDPKHPKFLLLSQRPVHKINNYEQLIISPDGHWLVMAGLPGGILEVWNIADDVPRFVKEISYPTQRYTGFLASSKDGRRLALFADGDVDAPKDVILLWDVDWDAMDGPTLTPFGEPIPGAFAALSPDGQRLVKSNVFGTNEVFKTQVLDLSVLPPRIEFECGGQTHNLAFQFSPDGNWLAICPEDVILRQKTDSGWEERARIPTSDGQNCRLWFLPDGKTLIVGEFFTGVMRAWDLTANPPVERFPSQNYRSVEFSPDGRLLATTGGEANAVWQLDGARPQRIAELGRGQQLLNAPPSFSSDSKLVAFANAHSAVSDMSCNVWDISLGTPQMIGDSNLPFVRFASEGQSVQAGNVDQLFSLPWEINKRGRFLLGSKRTDVAKLPNGIGHSISLRNLRPSVDRYVNLQAQDKLQVWSLKDDTKPLCEVQHREQAGIQDFALSDDGDLLAAFTNGGTSLVWDLTETPPREYLLPSRTWNNTHSFFTADGKLLIVARGFGIDIHDWAAGRLVRTIPFPGDIHSLARHPDGQHVATVNGNGTVYILRLSELAEHAQSK